MLTRIREIIKCCHFLSLLDMVDAHIIWYNSLQIRVAIKKIPVDVDVDKKVFKVVDGEAVEVGVRFVHFDGIEILVGWNVFSQLKYVKNTLRMF